MPQDQGQEHLVPMSYPITGEEVNAMFRAPPSQPPYPDAETCDGIADFLSKQMPQYAERFRDPHAYVPTQEDANFRERWIEASRVMRATKSKPHSFLTGLHEEAATILDRALKQAETLLMIQSTVNPNPQLKQWAVVGAITVMLAIEALQELTNKPVGAATGNSRAARFAELAIERIGWRDRHQRRISAGALAKNHDKLMGD